MPKTIRAIDERMEPNCASPRKHPGAAIPLPEALPPKGGCLPQILPAAASHAGANAASQPGAASEATPGPDSPCGLCPHQCGLACLFPGGYDFTPRLPRALPLSAGASPIAWVGGKAKLARRVIELMPAHACYCEPFCGAAHVLFRKEPSPMEIINDINGELVNFFRVLGSPQGLAWLLARHKWACYSRQEFEHQRDLYAPGLSEPERAWRFLYINRCAFGCKIKSRPTFGVSKTPRRIKPKDLASLGARLKAAHRRLAEALIENRHYADCIGRYDSRDTFFYLDPPYMGSEDSYGLRLFDRDNYPLLADQLGAIQGKFLLSINDTPQARAVFKNFRLRAEFNVSWSISKDRRRNVGELLFANF